MVYKDFRVFATTDSTIYDREAITDGNPSFPFSNQAFRSLFF